MENENKPRRLCSEIQLFDICDRDVCSKKDGRFCTDSAVLDRFEGLQEEDDRTLVEGDGTEGDEDLDDIDDDEFFDAGEYGEEDEPDDDW